MGFEVHEAETGDEAANLLKQVGQVRLVLSDVRMPGALTGIDLARMVKREWPSMRVLLTTGYVDGEDRIDDLDLLYKPTGRRTPSGSSPCSGRHERWNRHRRRARRERPP